MSHSEVQSQKQPPQVFCKKRCSQKFRKIHRKTSVPESLFWTPGGSRKGPIKQGLPVLPSVLPSFRPSFRLSGRFLGIVSSIFSKFWHGARIPFEVVCDRAGFSLKIFFAPKIRKMGPKWAKSRVFSIRKKIILFSVFLHKSHIWENFCF